MIVPVYNSVDYLQVCLDALKTQDDPNFEVILVDDGSDDNTAELCAASGFTSRSLPHNKGQAVARNHGVQAATGTILAFLDADTVPPSNWVSRHRELLSEHPDAAMIVSGYSHSTSPKAAAQHAFWEVQFRREKLTTYIDSCVGSNCVVYREAFEAVGGYPEYYLSGRQKPETEKAVATAEDSELGYLLTQQGFKIVWRSDNPVAHRFRESWSGYFRQQMNYSQFLVVSVCRFPKKLFQKGIYSGEAVLLQLFCVAAFLLSPLALLLPDHGGVTALAMAGGSCLIFLVIHRRLLFHLSNEQPGVGLLEVLSRLFVSRVFWLLGLFVGAFQGLRMLFNYHVLRR